MTEGRPLSARKPKRKASSKKPDKPGSNSGLTADDFANFKKLGISRQLVEKAGIFRTTNDQARKIGFQFKGELGGLVFPYRSLTGKLKNGRLRRDKPEFDAEGKPQNKYVSMASKERLLYFPPGTAELLENTASVVVLRGERKSSPCHNSCCPKIT
jgi:hypothetical protein